MGKKKIKIRLGKKGKIEKELDVDNYLPEIRNELLDTVTFPFIFLNEDEEKIQKEDEAKTKLEDILDGKNLYLKKEIIKRKMIGEKYVLYIPSNRTNRFRNKSFIKYYGNW